MPRAAHAGPVRAFAAAALVLLLGLVPAPALGSSAGTIFSGPTSADPAAVYWNPGAMTLMRGTHALLFGGVSAIRLQYQRATPSALDGSTFPEADVLVAKPAATFGVVTDATLDRFRFGVGATIPILDGASWNERYDGKPSSTRYFALGARQVMFVISPAVAVRLHRTVSVGAGLDVVGMMLSHAAMTDFGAKINQIACSLDPQATCRLDAPLPREDPTYDARTELSGVGWGVGGFAGVLVTPVPWLRLGLAFHSGAGTMTLPVRIEVALPTSVRDFVARNLPSVTLPALTAQADVEVTSPFIVTAGVAVEPMEGIEIAADLHWIDYSTTSLTVANVTQSSTSLIDSQVLIKARDDAFLVGLRGAYQVLDALGVALRLEYEVNTRPEMFVSPVSIDFHKISVHAGLAWRAASWLTLTLEYGHYFLLDRQVEKSHFAPNAAPATPEEEGMDKPSPTGTYTGIADRVGLGVALTF